MRKDAMIDAHVTRRDFAQAALAAVAAPGISAAAGAKPKKIGSRSARTVAAVGRIGYEGVEFAGYYGRTAKELRQMLDGAGLKCCGTHIGIETLQGGEFIKTVASGRRPSRASYP